MSDQAAGRDVAAPQPDYATSLSDLVEGLIDIELRGAASSPGSTLDADYQAELQAVVTAELRQPGVEPDIHKLLTIALSRWAARP